MIDALTRIATAVIVVALAISCGKTPDPFGKLTKTKLSEWTADCERQLIEEPALKGKDPMMAGKRWREAAFQNASRRYHCKPPGWSIYVDGGDRIVGLCVDEDVRRRPLEEAEERSRRMITKHMSYSLADDITKGKCTFKPEKIGHELLRWSQDLPSVIKADGTKGFHEPVGAASACCWEVQEE